MERYPRFSSYFLYLTAQRRTLCNLRSVGITANVNIHKLHGLKGIILGHSRIKLLRNDLGLCGACNPITIS